MDDVIIVGAGPAGLSTAYWLQKGSIPFRIIEKTDIGSSWRQHYDTLKLHTLKAVSELPGYPMPGDYPTFVPKDLVVDYLDSYAEKFDFPIERGTTVTRAEFDTERGIWHIETDRGRAACRVLVLATGIWSTPVTPPFKGLGRFEGTTSHSAEYKNADRFRDQRVLVIGAGNSGSEIAVEVSQVAAKTVMAVKDGTTFVDYPSSEQAMRVAAWLFRILPDRIGHRMLARSRRRFDHVDLFWPDRPLPQVYPVVGYELPEAAERGDVQIVPTGIDHFTESDAFFEDGTSDRFDHIIFATGYRPTIDFLAPGSVQTNARGWPTLNRVHQSTLNPHLVCVGYDYPNTEGWFQSIPRVSRQAVDGLKPLLRS